MLGGAKTEEELEELEKSLTAQVDLMTIKVKDPRMEELTNDKEMKLARAK